MQMVMPIKHFSFDMCVIVQTSSLDEWLPLIRMEVVCIAKPACFVSCLTLGQALTGGERLRGALHQLGNSVLLWFADSFSGRGVGPRLLPGRLWIIRPASRGRTNRWCFRGWKVWPKVLCWQGGLCSVEGVKVSRGGARQARFVEVQLGHQWFAHCDALCFLDLLVAHVWVSVMNTHGKRELGL